MLETIASHLDSIAALAPTWGLVFVFVFMAIESSLRTGSAGRSSKSTVSISS